jgi:hypothetical protein
MCAFRAHIPGEWVNAHRVNLIPSPGSRATARSDLSLLERCRKLRRRIIIEQHPNLPVVLRLTARYDQAADQFA